MTGLEPSLDAVGAVGLCRNALPRHWAEARTILRLGHAQHLDRAGPVGQATDETPFLERGDQAMDAGFRFEVERVFISSKEGGTPVSRTFSAM
jgi:hypothetical protein